MNLLITIISLLLLVFGLISMVTPIPGGSLLIAGSLTGLICSSPKARFCMQWARARTPWFNKGVFWLEEKVGSRVQFVGEALKLTRPEGSDAKKHTP